MRLSVHHSTHYRFSQPTSHGLLRLRLKPKSTHGQEVLDWTMDLDGARLEAQYEDQHHNSTTLVSLEPGVQSVSLTCRGTVETSDSAGVIGRHSGHMPKWAFKGQTDLTRPGARMRAMCSAVESKGVQPIDRLHFLSQSVLDAVAYQSGHTTVETTGEEALASGHGVCQDHAHIFIGCARAMDLPARYVSGYLMMNDRIDQEAGHGWAEVFVEHLGWTGFDVSNGISPDARYVRVATGRDYAEAAPVSGLRWGDGDSELAVTLAVAQQLVEQ